MANEEPCEDCIRRSDIGLTDFEIVMCNGNYKEALKMLLTKIEKAPSVNPQPKIGHWLSQSEYCKMNNLIPSGLGCYFWCSECNYGIDYKYFHLADYNYCPKCGAKMQEVKHG